jgi:hypothetical protein
MLPVHACCLRLLLITPPHTPEWSVDEKLFGCSTYRALSDLMVVGDKKQARSKDGTKISFLFALEWSVAGPMTQKLGERPGWQGGDASSGEVLA